jgi:hypothetical protein
MAEWPMIYLGCPIKSKVGLFGLIKVVGQRNRLNMGGNPDAARKMIRYAHENEYINAVETEILHRLLSDDVHIAQSVRCKGIDL